MPGYLLDTSALLCHCFDERGADRVHDILMNEEDVLIAAPTVLELHVALAWAVHPDPDGVIADYLEAVAGVVQVTLEVAQRAWSLRSTATRRVPTVDCLIAACAAEAKATLVHRDAHLARIEARYVKQLVLNAK